MVTAIAVGSGDRIGRSDYVGVFNMGHDLRYLSVPPILHIPYGHPSTQHATSLQCRMEGGNGDHRSYRVYWHIRWVPHTTSTIPYHIRPKGRTRGGRGTPMIGYAESRRGDPHTVWYPLRGVYGGYGDPHITIQYEDM